MEPSKKFQGELRPYQKFGLSWLEFLQKVSLGGCLADDMGLGKTIQILALLQKRKYAKKKTSQTSCIVVPKSLLLNWNKEAQQFTPNLKVHLHEGQHREVSEKNFSQYDIVLMTYGIMARDIMSLKDIHFDYTILDEAQKIKNELSQGAKAASLLRSTHKLALTGTPVENHLGELFSIFKYLLPGVFHHRISSYKNLRELNDTTQLILKGLRPFILKRNKQDVLKELPEKMESIIYCEMEPKQISEYNKVKNYYKTHLTDKISIQGINKSKIQILEALTRLRQVACHPGLLDPKKEVIGSGKMQVLIEQLLIIKDEGGKSTCLFPIYIHVEDCEKRTGKGLPTLLLSRR